MCILQHKSSAMASAGDNVPNVAYLRSSANSHRRLDLKDLASSLIKSFSEGQEAHTVCQSKAWLNRPPALQHKPRLARAFASASLSPTPRAFVNAILNISVALSYSPVTSRVLPTFEAASPCSITCQIFFDSLTLCRHSRKTPNNNQVNKLQHNQMS
jgi:hypothetical protein